MRISVPLTMLTLVGDCVDQVCRQCSNINLSQLMLRLTCRQLFNILPRRRVPIYQLLLEIMKEGSEALYKRYQGPSFIPFWQCLIKRECIAAHLANSASIDALVLLIRMLPQIITACHDNFSFASTVLEFAVLQRPLDELRSLIKVYKEIMGDRVDMMVTLSLSTLHYETMIVVWDLLNPHGNCPRFEDVERWTQCIWLYRHGLSLPSQLALPVDYYHCLEWAIIFENNDFYMAQLEVVEISHSTLRKHLGVALTIGNVPVVKYLLSLVGGECELVEWTRDNLKPELVELYADQNVCNRVNVTRPLLKRENLGEPIVRTGSNPEYGKFSRLL